MTNEIGVGVIGFGLAAQVFHCPFVEAVPGLTLRAIVQRSGGEAEAAYPAAKVLRTVAEMLADPAVGLVVVATPNETHFEMARQALAAGKHVVIDKPFAATSVEARELIELAERMGVVVAPFHNRRWDGDFMTVRKLVEGGVLGRVVTVESHFDRYRPIQREGTWKEAASAANGMLMDLGPHLVDQAVALYGIPQTITASVRTDRDKTAIEDAFDICLQYDRLLYWCRATMLGADNSPRFLVHGVGGSFRKHGLDPQEPALVAGGTVPIPGEREAMWGTLTVAHDLAAPEKLTVTRVQTEVGDYRGFYASVRDAVNGVAKLAVPSEEGFAVIRLLELARVSSSEGRTVVV